MKLLLVLIVLFATACMDQDPFGLSTRDLPGGYELYQSEGELYYLLDPGGREEAGGYALGGTVEEIGWNAEFILARRRANFGGDPNGWMVVDTRSRTISGPFTAAQLNKLPAFSRGRIRTLSPTQAWDRLGS